MKLSIAYIIENEENEFFRMSLKSVLPIADEIVIIDGGSIDGTFKLLDEFKDERIKVIHKPYLHNDKGANGLQREEYLKWVTGDWVLVLDGDEILSDNGFLLKEVYANNKEGIDVYSVQMVHFIGNLSKRDATFGGTPQLSPNYKHHVPRRFFRRTPNLSYPHVEHPTLEGFPGKESNIDDVIIYHMGYLKGLDDIIAKYKNHLTKSNIHNPEFLKWWKNAHLLGQYPVADIKLEDINSYLIRELVMK
jgi:glycosyltransferase involved in cell wall biosynthesis